MKATLEPRDALIVVDVQRDFLPGGRLAVPQGDQVVPVLNRFIRAFSLRGLPVFATRDWHPENHCSFREQGGPWPPHCVAESEGASFAPDLELPPGARVVSKATTSAADAYSGFEGTNLDTELRDMGVKRVFVGGLATDYCVLNTVMDARRLGYLTFLLDDAVRAVNVNEEDDRRAHQTMLDAGAVPIRYGDIET